MIDKAQELAEAINLTGGKTYPKKFNKIISLYAKGDIDYDVALYAIKEVNIDIYTCFKKYIGHKRCG